MLAESWRSAGGVLLLTLLNCTTTATATAATSANGTAATTLTAALTWEEQ